jgi:hypothetical protein
MLTWKQFSAARPDLARVGASLLYEFGDLGLGFLATVRADGGPRVHPVCPMVTEDGLYAFVVPGPKLTDLRRDARYALHSETFPPPRHDDAFYVTGHAEEHDDPQLRTSLTAQFLREHHLDEPWPEFDDQALVEFRVERCLVTLTEAREGLPAGHTIWSAQPTADHP